MRRTGALIRLAAAAAVAVSVVPLSARAGVACVAFRDRAGDARVTGPMSSPDRLDIVAGGIVTGEAELLVDLALRSLRVPPRQGERDRYAVEWRTRDRVHTLEAIATLGGWSFSATTASDSRSTRDAVRGSVDRERGLVTFHVPYTRELTPGTLMTDVKANTYDNAASVGGGKAAFDVPGVHRDSASGGDVIAGPGCSRPLNASGQRCALADDAKDDVELTPLTTTADRSIDIRSLRAASNDTALVFEVGVADIGPVPEDAQAQTWTVSWQVGSDAYSATAIRDRGGARFTWTAPDGASTDALGVVDERDSTVTVAVTRAAFPLRDGMQITGISVHAADLSYGNAESQSDDAPEDVAAAPSYAIAIPCARQHLQLCPVVRDATGDAGPVQTWDGRTLPENQEALDVLAAGAQTSPNAILVSIRIADLSAPPPAGYETLGYTASWHRSDGRRFYAEATKTGSVWSYSYGIDASPDDGPSGAVFGGVRTTGSADASRGVITVAVPRSLLDNTTNLPRYGATSWALVPGNTVAAYQTVDATPMGSYRVGIACGA